MATESEETPGPTRIEATLADYPSCHTGAVRLYVDRRYTGQFDENGFLAVDIRPGEHTVEVWDSAGHWLTEIFAPEGETLSVTFSCSEKELISEGRGSETSDSGGS